MEKGEKTDRTYEGHTQRPKKQRDTYTRHNRQKTTNAITQKPTTIQQVRTKNECMQSEQTQQINNENNSFIHTQIHT